MLHPVVIFVAGLLVIIVGAELLLRAASRIAATLGIKPVLVGLTVVAVGTSAPELAVGITASVEGRGAMAVGNIAGTNLFNILFILGLSAAIRPLPIHLSSIKFDVPVMIAAAVLLLGMAWDGTLSRAEGAVLVVFAVLYIAVLIRVSRRESGAVQEEFAHEYGSLAIGAGSGWVIKTWNVTLLVVGIALTLLGADLMVEGAVELARGFGVSDAMVGLTIIAIGTSAPELATTVLATVRNDRDVAVGNLVGSSISNIVVILGITCLVSPQGIDVSSDVLWIDLPLAAAVALLCYPVFRTDRMVSRAEGILFVALYLAYMGTLIVLRV
jgi:cation:H+ antiporter